MGLFKYGCLSQCVTTRTDCIVFHGKTAGSQVCGHNELYSTFHGLNLAAIHAQGKWP